jgi:hypothetical protein
MYGASEVLLLYLTAGDGLPSIGSHTGASHHVDRGAQRQH